MIFGPALLPKVLDGSKIETRRRKHQTDLLSTYRPGRDYAVQARRGGRAVARMLVEAVHWETLADLTEEAARREGFEGVAGFEAYWRLLYHEWEPSTEVWVIRFALLRPCIYCARQTAHLFAIEEGRPRVPACDADHIAAWLREADLDRQGRESVASASPTTAALEGPSRVTNEPAEKPAEAPADAPAEDATEEQAGDAAEETAEDGEEKAEEAPGSTGSPAAS
jgi:hypothetical protein